MEAWFSVYEIIMNAIIHFLFKEYLRYEHK